MQYFFFILIKFCYYFILFYFSHTKLILIYHKFINLIKILVKKRITQISDMKIIIKNISLHYIKNLKIQSYNQNNFISNTYFLN